MIKRSRSKYYDETDFSDIMKTQKGKRIDALPKRITLNISDKIYNEANELDSYMRMGYQNVLKTAITIGLTNLFDQVSKHKIIKK